MAAQYEMRLSKEDFKFSAAHFTVFSPSTAEVLHGHNYRVRVEIIGPATDELGLLMDLRQVKADIRGICARLDSKTLVPVACSEVGVEQSDGQVQVRFGERSYELPIESVVLLPLRNTSIEELALYVWQELAPGLADSGATRLGVVVEETRGQGCLYSAELEKASKS